MNTYKAFDKTPVLKSHAYSSASRNIYYKMECYQPTGSFKPRGMSTLITHYLAQGQHRFITSSGGNAGYSLAYICQASQAELTVVVPNTTSPYMIAKIRNLGATIEVHGNNWNEAHAHALDLSSQLDLVYVHPFDHPMLWKGYATLIEECVTQMAQPDKIVLSVGGGGLLCGVLEGLENHGWTDTQVITAETEGAASFYESYRAGELVTLEQIDTIATSIGSRRVAQEALTRSQKFDTTPNTVSDAEAVKACRQFLDEYNVLVEPACGAALSVAYDRLSQDNTDKQENILVIVCGGVGFSLDQYLKHTA